MVETPSNDLDSEDKLVWEDVLSNSAVPVNDDSNETQESTTNEFVREITASLQAVQDSQADSSSDWDAEDHEVFDKDIASSGTDAESGDHVTDLTTVDEIEKARVTMNKITTTLSIQRTNMNLKRTTLPSNT